MDRTVLFICAAVMILAGIREVRAGNCADASSCNSHGTCPDTSAPCVCTDGYSGDDCSTAPVCTSGGSECGSHGSCDTSGSTYACTCTDGYTGNTCGTAPCTSGGGECGDHGTCNTSGSTVKCDCNADYTGTLCKEKSGGSRVTFLSQLFLIPMVASLFM
ncbi:delta-like protein D isoform X2 [Haliotis asinina]|uniref:delta-like protein D isoform X2 n=1 Tax=Haliotis asinina TaxID=109174 RepID=UPI003531B696